MEGGKERDEGKRGREGRLRREINGRKKRACFFMCKRLGCMDICCHRHISFCIIIIKFISDKTSIYIYT